MNGRGALSLALVMGGLLSAGCGKAEPSPAGSSQPLASASASSGAALASASASASPPASSSAPAPSERAPVGGPWVGCYARFRPTSSAARDVTRLAILCGPANGMRQTGPVIEGVVEAGGATKEHVVQLDRGQCVRAFAVGEAPIVDLDLALHAPSGARLAQDGIDDRWPVLLPDRPVCVSEAGAYTVRVSSRGEGGRYALSVWLLP